jgi:hypothetical protein
MNYFYYEGSSASSQLYMGFLLHHQTGHLNLMSQTSGCQSDMEKQQTDKNFSILFVLVAHDRQWQGSNHLCSGYRWFMEWWVVGNIRERAGWMLASRSRKFTISAVADIIYRTSGIWQAWSVAGCSRSHVLIQDWISSVFISDVYSVRADFLSPSLRITKSLLSPSSDKAVLCWGVWVRTRFCCWGILGTFLCFRSCHCIISLHWWNLPLLHFAGCAGMKFSFIRQSHRHACLYVYICGDPYTHTYGRSTLHYRPTFYKWHWVIRRKAYHSTHVISLLPLILIEWNSSFAVIWKKNSWYLPPSF